MKLAKIVRNGMQKMNSRRTEETLGDRTAYIGASDLGQCPRKAVMGKIFPEDPDLTTLIRFERGHLAEDMLGEALKNEGFHDIKRQAELTGETKNGTPLKFHLDFVHQTKNRFAIMEAKSTSPVPSEPYEGWEMQLHVQMGLARMELGDEVEIEGTIFALDMNPKECSSPYGVWNQYRPDPELYQALMDEADTIYRAVREYKSSGNLSDDLSRRPGPLCGFCPYLDGCPSFEGEQLDELAPQVEEYADLQARKKLLDKEITGKKEELKAVLRQKGWVSVSLEDGTVKKLKVNTKTSRRTDFKALREALSGYNEDSLDNYVTPSSYEELQMK